MLLYYSFFKKSTRKHPPSSEMINPFRLLHFIVAITLIGCLTSLAGICEATGYMLNDRSSIPGRAKYFYCLQTHK
jgi:hypothetical protein